MNVAVREDHMEMAEFLLKEGANVNVVDQDQRSVPNNIAFVTEVLIFPMLLNSLLLFVAALSPAGPR